MAEPRDESYLRDLLVRIYEPDQPTGAAVVEVHGGAWSSGNRKAGDLYNRAVAAAGILVAAIDFRQGPEHHHPAGSDDVAAAIGWLSARADRVGVVGSSSGGHLALLAACSGAPVQCVAALWAPVDPLARYRYALASGLDHLARATEAYFVTEDAMADASVPRVLESGEAKAMPPLLVVQPEPDRNVPVSITQHLLRAYKGHVEHAHFPGQPHGFGHIPGPATDQFIAVLCDFLKRHLA